MFLKFLGKYPDFGLLLARLGVGFMYLYVHGAAKFFGGPERWAKVGKAMSSVGVEFFPVFWGFMAAFSEFFGGMLLILGLFFRPACVLIIITMTVAASMHLSSGDGLGGASHAIENGIFLLGLLFVGPGKYSIDAKLGKS